MRHVTAIFGVLFLLLSLLPGSAFVHNAAAGQKVVYGFSSPPDEPLSGLVRAGDGNFYGTTITGGVSNDGTVYRVTPAGALTVMTSFFLLPGNPLSGTIPSPLLVASDGNLYGELNTGGGVGFGGVIFKMTLDGTLSHVASIPSSDGIGPVGGLVEGASGVLYGVAEGGGTFGGGSFFKVTLDGTLTTLFAFAGSNGSRPQSRLVLANDGNFYGTTQLGGANGTGTVYRITPEGAESVVHSFGISNGNLDGLNPTSPLVVGQDGKLYGVAPSGGPGGHGTIFKLTTTGEFNTIVTFPDARDIRAYDPVGPMVQRADGKFILPIAYLLPATNWGVFEISTSGDFATVALAGNTFGPQGGLVFDNDGALYGATAVGGADGSGTVFKVSAAGKYSVINEFLNPTGAEPFGALVPATATSFFGVTYNKGGKGGGTVFEVTTSGDLHNVISLGDSTSPGRPSSGISRFVAGNLFGTVGYEVFELTPSGMFSTLALVGSFNSGLPLEVADRPAVVEGENGELFGTTYDGGTDGKGSVFKITTMGIRIVLASFNGPNGAYPDAGLLRGHDGNFYGTTERGGAFDIGTVFKCTPEGVLSSIVSFAGLNGQTPKAGLIEATDGNFYGTTYEGGRYGGGSVYRMSHDGTLTTLASFKGGEGATGPVTALLQGSDGNFYGTTSLYLTFSPATLFVSGSGTVFKMTPDGTLTDLAIFGGIDDLGEFGEGPSSALVEGADGYLYGTTSRGGPGGGGIIYQVATDSTPTLPTTTTTTLQGGTTTSTTLPCATANCVISAAVSGPACSDQPVPKSVVKSFNSAAQLIARAQSLTSRKAAKLYKRAKAALKKASAGTKHAAKRKKNQITGGCAAALQQAVDNITSEFIPTP